MNVLEKKWPSVTSRPGRSTADKSTWPHGCGKYQAAVKSGEGDLAMLSGSWPLVSTAVVQVVATPRVATVQVVVALGTTPASEPSTPAGVPMSVSGVSADTENELPHQAGIV